MIYLWSLHLDTGQHMAIDQEFDLTTNKHLSSVSNVAELKYS